MPSPSINVSLASFSPSSDFFALASGDGRIKIWDTTKGNLQTELSNLTVTATTVSGDTGIRPEPEGGHLSVDYTCMKWVQIGGKKKKKKKPGRSILVLGTGSGDVLGIDVAAGQLNWKLSDCHHGGVSAVSFSTHGSCIYTAGADGIICRIDTSGNLLNKFRSSTKAISSLSISADGKLLAAASAQIKVFSCSDNKKIQKFSGHTVGVRCMIFSEDGRYILSSAVGEKYVAIWKTGDGTKQSACCVLPMEHPAVSLDSMGSDGKGADSAGLYVSALSEKGLCYFWYANSIEELHSSKPTRISSIKPSLSKSSKGLTIYAAKLQGIVSHASGAMLVAYGSLIKPSFEKIVVDYGVDLKLDAPQEGLLVPGHQFNISRKGQSIRNNATALDRVNAEDAVHPLPKLHGHDNKRKHGRFNSDADVDDAMVDPIVNRQNKTFGKQEEGVQMIDEVTICLEDRLRAVGILNNSSIIRENHERGTEQDTSLYKGAHLAIDTDMPAAKVRSHLSSISPSDSCKLLETLVSGWKTRSIDSKHASTWVYYILVNHGQFIALQGSSGPLLDALQKMTNLRSTSVRPLLKLLGRLRLIKTQIDRSGQSMVETPSDVQHEDSSEDEDEDIDELVYGEDMDDSLSESDDNDKNQL